MIGCVRSWYLHLLHFYAAHHARGRVEVFYVGGYQLAFRGDVLDDALYSFPVRMPVLVAWRYG